MRITAYNLITAYRASIFDGARAPECIAPELLIIDDLGSEPRIANITCEYLFSIINERQSRGKATAIASNLSPEGILDAYSERLFSRITAPRTCTVIMLEGDDLRMSPLRK